MNKIKILLEYKCFPIWCYDETGILIENDSPEELRNNKEIDDKLLEIQSRYNDLFVYNENDFYYSGFKNEEDKQSLKAIIDEIYLQIKSIVGNTYIIENCIELD